MKKILYTFLAVSIIFAACKKDDNNTATATNSQFSGDWAGTFSGDDSGLWTAIISSTGSIDGSSTSSSAGNQTLSGSVTNSGSFAATVGTGTLGSEFVGQFSGNSGSGTWSNLSAGFTGTWEGTKQ